MDEPSSVPVIVYESVLATWITEISAEALHACGTTPAAVFSKYVAAGYTLHAIDDIGGLARSSEGQTLVGGNFLALPAERSLD